MNQLEYDKVELPAIQQLASLGWNYVDGRTLTDTSEERDSMREVVLKIQLNQAIEKLIYESHCVERSS